MSQATGFKDHFSGHAESYARHRPVYPAELYAWLASVAPDRRRAWDCGTGNGQAAVALAAHFDEVVATDPSEPQIASAFPHPRVRYRVAPAEAAGVEPGTVSLVTVAQALHWFDIPAFYRQAEAALVPGGVLAAWGYELIHVSPEVDPVVMHLYDDVVGPYWPPERKILMDGYRTVDFPFEEIAAPAFSMERRWTLDDLLGYLRTWSAVKRFEAALGTDPVARVASDLAAAWGAEEEKTVRWPLAFRAGRKPV
jgi:SAM-dependent methyltransferase